MEEQRIPPPVTRVLGRSRDVWSYVMFVTAVADPDADLTSTVNVVRSFFGAYNAHDVDKMLAACSPDAQLRYVPMGKQGRGPIREVGKQFWSGLIDAFPDLTVKVERAFGDDNNVAAEVMIGGTQRKDFLGIANQGKRYDLPHAFLVKLNKESLITEVACYWDNVTFYSQLGKNTIP
jgi:steroid delta-isomerase-like uncharacterized protein